MLITYQDDEVAIKRRASRWSVAVPYCLRRQRVLHLLTTVDPDGLVQQTQWRIPAAALQLREGLLSAQDGLAELCLCGCNCLFSSRHAAVQLKLRRGVSQEVRKSLATPAALTCACRATGAAAFGFLW